MSNVKGLRTCSVCGRDFALIAEEAYVARDDKQSGIANVISSKEEKLYDAFNCPHCGCQNIIQERKRTFIEAVEESDDEDDFTGCSECLYDVCGEDETPCNVCKHCVNDSEVSKYTPKEDK